jgi:hypothetical protein
MTRGIIRDVFRDHYEKYRCTRKLSVREQRAAQQIQTCRTEAQGHHVVRCENGDYEAERFNSCKHRSCPVCGTCDTDRWVRQQETRALPCPYHQIVFTMPDGLHPLWRYNRTGFTNLLFKAAWESLQAFTDDPRWFGATPGATGVFQSWGGTLNIHVHLHVLITAGGLTTDGRWVRSRNSFFCPSVALSVKFRGCLRALLLAGLADGGLQIPPGTTAAAWRMWLNKFGRQKWHVQIEPAYEHPRGAIRYLGAYMKCGPIGESRIKRYDGRTLSIAHKHPEDHSCPTFELSAEEFITRFLTHVPPKGQRVVRHFGLFHHRRRQRLEQARQLLAAEPSGKPEAARAPAAARPIPPAMRCPHCGKPLVVVTVSFRRRAPPERRVA